MKVYLIKQYDYDSEESNPWSNVAIYKDINSAQDKIRSMIQTDKRVGKEYDYEIDEFEVEE